ncbi:hypothetical protein XENOCAPTIV_022228 [Xenoophorus captivus]|uniref:Uncharacterized protein n=1 Tax=Xenoophorus captivus TaxID=1517983 RepID=A0ABV0REM8_9TELE
MRTKIMEVLDMDLIRQQAENDAVDIQGLASYIITTMGKMCAPVRDEEIRNLRESTDNIRNYPPLTPEVQATLTGQICSISQKDNPIRTLVEDRVQQYFMVLLSNPKTQNKLEQVPAGLTAIKPELVQIGKTFISFIDYNRAVYGPFYMDIIRKLLFGSRPPAPILSQEQVSNCHVFHE